MLYEGSHDYHTFKIPKEKRIRLRGIPQIITTEKMKQNLMHVEFKVVVISRMYRKIEDASIEMMLILVQLAKPNGRKNISNVSNLGTLLIKAEPQKTRTAIHQYRKCQIYGDNQDR